MQRYAPLVAQRLCAGSELPLEGIVWAWAAVVSAWIEVDGAFDVT